MQGIAAGNYRSSVVAIIDFLILSREGIDVEAVSVQEISQLVRSRHVNILGITQLVPDFQQPLDYLKRCETLCWIPESRHILIHPCTLAETSAVQFDYEFAAKVVHKFNALPEIPLPRSTFR